ncbi:MAG: ABC transporter permease [Acidobacteria bacterium]|nr:ABC transporter permease [Acidobacteriota bacterium]
MFQDLKFALRSLRRSPGFAAVTVLTLTIGIGAVAAISGIADTALLHPLPFPHSDRLVTLNEVVPLITPNPIRLTAPDLIDYERQTQSFDAVAGFSAVTFELSGTREAISVQGVRATASLFRVLEIPPLLGRTFTPEEDDGGSPVCVISYGLWQRWFGGDPRALAATVDLDRKPYRIIGVMPRGFEFPLRGSLQGSEPVSLWVPMSFTPRERAAIADSWDYDGVARMKPGVTVAQATADVNIIAQRILLEVLKLPEAAGSHFTFTALARPLAAQVSGRVRPLLLALAGAVLFVLLIACVNVTNLLLARGANREREIAIRRALGAGRLHILRQLVAETLILGFAAAAAGTLLAWWCTEALPRVVPVRFAVLAAAHMNWRALLFTASITIVAALAVAAVPAFAAARGPVPEGSSSAHSAATLFAALKDRGASASGVRHHALRSALIVAETALAIVLLVGAGLLVQSFRDLLNTDPGFAPENAVAGAVSLPRNQYPDPVRIREFRRELLDRVQAIPGAEFAGMGSALPLSGANFQRAFWPDDYTPPAGTRLNTAAMTVVSGQYLQAIGATLIRGRLFTPQDTVQAPRVAVITQSIAKQFWPGKDPVGKRIRWGVGSSSDTEWLTVVGVVGDVKQSTLDAPADMQIYVPAEQVEASLAPEYRLDFTVASLNSMYVVLRGHGSTDALAGSLRQAVQSMDARLPVSSLRPLSSTLAASAAPQRFNMALMTSLGGIALLLAAVGIFGVTSYSVAQRTQEIGIRMALGATGSGISAMVLRDALRLAAAGVLIGSVAAAGLAPLLRTLLFGVKPLDPLTFAAVAALLVAVSTLASYVPARRAAIVDPMVALRWE